jgi:hypothetical protein
MDTKKLHSEIVSDLISEGHDLDNIWGKDFVQNVVKGEVSLTLPQMEFLNQEFGIAFGAFLID